MKRRGFLYTTLVLPILSATQGLQIHLYSVASKVGPWAGWLQNKAGDVVAFFTKSGEIVWMK